MLLAMVRHRAAAVRRCMALLAASARALLRDLLRWQAPRHADAARQCAEHLSHLYEDIAERKVCKLWSFSSLAYVYLGNNFIKLLYSCAEGRLTTSPAPALLAVAFW